MEWKRDSVDQSLSLYDHTSGAGGGGGGGAGGEQAVPLYGEAASAHRGSALAALRLLTSYNHFLVPPDVHNVVGPLLAALPPAAPCLPPYCQHLPLRSPPMLSTCEEIRRRGEKRPIPAEMKDEKYFERRRRNNQAAKKSRDARRIREDQIAWRAYLLEQENSTLRAHVATLRQEALALRGLLAARDHPAAVSAPELATAAAAPSSTTPD